MLWKPESKVEIKGLSSWCIDLYIDYDKAEEKWRLMGFYSHPNTSKREETWSILKSFGQNNQLPWLCIGDFNEITSGIEKTGGNPRLARQMDWFRRVINLCAFHDWGFMGSPFTWSKNNGVEGKIHVRLDRAIANNDWLTKFLRTKLHHIAMSTSDHHLLVLRFMIANSRSQGGGKLFRFEEMWLQDPICDEVVQEAWQEGLCKQGGVQFENYMESCRARLVSWKN